MTAPNSPNRKEAIHVYPEWEENIHTLTGTACICDPKLEEYDHAVIVIHNRMDN